VGTGARDGKESGSPGLEHGGWIGGLEFAEGEGAGKEAHGEGEGEDEEGFVVEEGHGEEGGLAGEMIEVGGEGHAGEEAEDGEDEGGGGDEGSEKALGIAHGLEGGVLGQVIVHLGEEDLVDDHHSDHETHHRSEGEDETDRCDLLPVASFPRDEFPAVHDMDFVGHAPGDSVFHGGDIGVGMDADDPDIGLGEGAIREVAEEVEFAGDEIAIGGEGGAEVEDAGDGDSALAEMGFDRGVGAEGGADGTEAGVRTAVEEGGVHLPESGGMGSYTVEGEHTGGGVASEDEQGAFSCVPGISPTTEADIHLGGGLDAGDGEGLGDATAGEGDGPPQGLALAVDEEEIAGEVSLDSGGAVEEGVLEAQLHEHEHHGEHHPGDSGNQFEGFMGQLTPGQLQRTDPGIALHSRDSSWGSGSGLDRITT